MNNLQYFTFQRKLSGSCSAAERTRHGSRRTAALAASVRLRPQDHQQRRGSNRGHRRKLTASARLPLYIIETLDNIGAQLADIINARRRAAHQFISYIELLQQKKLGTPNSASNA